MELRGALNFESHIPYYIQLMDLLQSQIQEKAWLPGEQIPGEQELCDHYGISRTVVRQALRELEFGGAIMRRKGKGTFVAEPKINEGLIQKLTGFYQDMVERGLKPVTQVIHQLVVPANEKVARYLNIPVGTKVIDIQRLRFINNEPIQLVTTFIPYAACPQLAEADITDCSLYEYLRTQCGIVLDRGVRYLEAVAANETEAMLLGIEKNSPLMMIDSISYVASGQAVEYYHALHRGDRSRFEVNLVRLPDAHPDKTDTDVSR
jgi:GntR family transcriptional regulator